MPNKRRIAFSTGDRLIEAVILGKPYIANFQGQTNLEKGYDYWQEISDIFRYGPPRYMVSALCEHKGEIIRINPNGVFMITDSVSYAQPLAEHPPERVELHCDAIVCPARHVRNLDKINLILKTRDCVPLSGTDGDNFFVAHLSNQTLFGYGTASGKFNSDSFESSILHRLFSSFINPFHCSIAIGPSIGGTINQRSIDPTYQASEDDDCECYGYTEKPDQKDGSLLLECISRQYPGIDLEQFYDNSPVPSKGKIVFHWSKLILALLKYHGVLEQRINPTYNFCTLCNHRKFYSQRYHNQHPEQNNESGYNLTIVSSRKAP